MTLSFTTSLSKREIGITKTTGGRKHCRGFSVRQDPLQGRTAHTKCRIYLLGPSLAAALPVERRVSPRRGWAGEKSGLFEHPRECSPVVPDHRSSAVQKCFFRSLLEHELQTNEVGPIFIGFSER
jgi:hypothetical protein